MKKYFFVIILVVSSMVHGQLEMSTMTPEGLHEENAIYIKFHKKNSLGKDVVFSSQDDCISNMSWLVEHFEQGDIISIQREFKVLSARNSELALIYRINISPSFDINLALSELQDEPYVDFAEKIPIYRIEYTPTDPAYTDPSKRWHLDQINAETAWDITIGSDTIVIAVVDDAILTSHEDLINNIYTNTIEVVNGIDDDGNGYIDDLNGYDVADGDGNPNPPGSVSLTHFSHGTHVSGIAAGTSDNAYGTSSIGFNTSILPVKTMNDTNTTGYLLHAIQGVEYAIASEVDIINMSWGSYAFSNAHRILFDYALSEGITCVASAGNDYLQAMLFPAGYPSVISVGATDATDDYTSFSNWSSVIDVYAPGLDIWSPVGTGSDQYAFFSGTSMSAPIVSGICALMLCNDPTFTAIGVKQCLINSSSLHPSLQSVQTIRVVDAEQSLLCTPPTTYSCDANLCELISNGGFEVPENSGIIEYQQVSGLADGSLCSWQSYIQTTDIFPWEVAGNNHFSSSFSPKGIGFTDVIEGVVSNVMPIIANNMYRLEFDMSISAYPGVNDTVHPYTATDLDSVVIGLVHQDYDWVQISNNLYLDTIRLTTLNDVPVDYMNTIGWDAFDTLDFVSVSNHYLLDFQAPSDTIYSRLFIYARHITEGERPFMQLDNISVKPISNYPVVVTASDTTIDVGQCVDLSVSGQVTTYYWEPQGLFADPWLQNQSICLDSTTTFYVSVLDTNLQCFQTESITIHVGVDWQNIDEEGFVLNIFPNPTDNFVEIQSSTKIDLIEVCDMSGRVLDSSNEELLNFTKYQDGVYLLQIYIGENKFIRKIVKQ